ncbi:phospholipase D family protein [Rhodococcus olei]|uniref:Phospholipase D family protein n=1 Tax=Rhodococcus olei TaxID=2161675 RepID=A0ABP8P3F9_9NOCA
MLSPDSRVLLTDALQPPVGYAIDSVVTTTYSLDLTALLLAPLSFAARTRSEDVDDADPIALLESIRRYVGSMTVFAQAGGLKVPSKYRTVLSFAENSVVEVRAPQPGRLFHPKIWLLRFVCDDAGGYLHRFLCSSRNLTFDASWDTLLVLDEDPDTDEAVDPAPIAEFVAALPDLATTPMTGTRAAAVRDLAHTVRSARFACPAPFASMTLHPLGLTDGAALPVPEAADRALVISPFFDPATSRRFAAIAPDSRIVSRAETFDRTGSDAFTGAQTFTLQAVADRPGDDEAVAEPGTEVGGVPSGLHAKTFVFDTAKEAVLITGSANATSAALGGNVEFSAALRGPSAKCGVDAVWESGKGTTGLARIVEPYTITAAAPDVDADALARVEKDMADFRALLSAAAPQLHFVLNGGSAQCTLRVPEEIVGAFDGEVAVSPVSLTGEYRPLATEVTWSGVAAANVTAFIGVRTRRDGVELFGVVKAALHGDVVGRDRLILRSHIGSAQDLTRCLLFLLGGEVPGDGEVLGLDRGSTGDRDPGRGAVDDTVLFEPLVRAVVGDRAALERVDALLRDLDAPTDLVDDDLRALLDAVRLAHTAVAGGDK